MKFWAQLFEWGKIFSKKTNEISSRKETLELLGIFATVKLVYLSRIKIASQGLYVA